MPQRQQLLSGGWVAGFDLGQNLCDIAHEDQHTVGAGGVPLENGRVPVPEGLGHDVNRLGAAQ